MVSADIVRQLRGFTIVTDVRLTFDCSTWASDLTVTLAADERPGADVVMLLCRGVSELTLRDFGGGLTQLLYLAIDDVRNEQLDRVRFRVREVERSNFSLACRDLSVVRGEPRK